MDKIKLLRQLGWSEELIKEVSRQSKNMQTIGDNLLNVEACDSKFVSNTGDKLFIDDQCVPTRLELKT